MTRKPAQLDNLARSFVLARREMQDATARYKKLQAQLMEALPGSKFSVDMEDGSAEVTVVTPTRYTWVDATVKQILPARLWNRVMTEAVNKDILEAMIKSNELAAYDMHAAKEFTEVAPYLRVTEKPRNAAVISISRKDNIA